MDSSQMWLIEVSERHLSQVELIFRSLPGEVAKNSRERFPSPGLSQLLSRPLWFSLNQDLLEAGNLDTFKPENHRCS